MMRVAFATWAIVTGKSAGGIFNPLPKLDEATAAKMAQRLSERAEGSITTEDVLSSENGKSIRLGSSLSTPLTAARPLRSARRTSQVCALAVASLKVGLAAWLSCHRQLSSLRSCPAHTGIGRPAARKARIGPVVSAMMPSILSYLAISDAVTF